MITTEQAKLFNTVGEYDIVVMGAGSGGIGAAVSAARQGMSVALVEQYGFAGGTGTLCNCPIYFGFGYNGRQITAGICDEVIRKLDAMDAVCFMTDNNPLYPDMQPIGYKPIKNMVMTDIPSMQVVYNKLLTDAGVDCLFYSYLTDAVVEDRQIAGALIGRIEGPGVIYGKYFIDGTGDALLIHYAGGETREYSPEYNMHKSLFFDMCNVGPYDLDYANNQYHTLFKNGETPNGCLDFFMHTEKRVPGVTLIAFGKTSGDALTSAGMTKMDMDMREQQLKIADFMRNKMPGFKNAEICGSAIRVGVRAGRGIVGIETLEADKVFSDYVCENPVALITKQAGDHSNNEKFMPEWSKKMDGLGAVPAGALISKSFDNAFACGRAISAEPMLTRTYRMMNTCMTTGEASGIMAAMAIKNKALPRNLNYSDLKEEMLKCGFILE